MNVFYMRSVNPSMIITVAAIAKVMSLIPDLLNIEALRNKVLSLNAFSMV
jgi:hypothetical protein